MTIPSKAQFFPPRSWNSNTKLEYRGKLVSLVAFVDPIHAINEEEKKQNAPLPEFNVCMKSFDCLLFTQPQNSSRHHKMPSWHVTTAINAILLQNPPKLERQSYYAFSRSTKHAKRSLRYFRDFSNIEKKFNTTIKLWSQTDDLT